MNHMPVDAFSGFMPHGHCFFWNPALLVLHVGSDLLIALAYYSIPLSLLNLVYRRRDTGFTWIFVLFSLFIFACGTSHIMSLINIWQAWYWLEGFVKLFTAGISVVTALLLWPLIPKLLAMPSLQSLLLLNQNLEAEIRERKAAETALKELNAELEMRVSERTHALAQFNSQLLQENQERILAERTLAKQTQALKRSNQDLEQFASVVSHDLREPLRAIQGFTQLLAQRYQGQLDAKADQYILHIVEGTKRMNGLINAILSYSRVGFQAPTWVSVELQQILAEVSKTASFAFASQAPEISFTDLPVIQGNPILLKQLFQNLISNGLKFNQSVPPRVEITARQEPDGWLVLVNDNGIGIPQKYLSRIFAVFQRLHTHEAYPGDGIGLAICQKIMEQSGGKIWVESQEDQGSTFYLFFPARSSASVSAEPLVLPADSPA
ncbi:MAG: ATP-binding protein [Candidatus Sericytochromatia bacterium]